LKVGNGTSVPRILTIILAAVAVVAALVGIRFFLMGGPDIATVEADAIPTLDRPVSSQGQARDGMQVAVRRSVAEVRPLYISISGRTEAARTVTVRAEMTGTITSAPAVEGRLVERGDVLCALDVEGKGARVREVEAEAKRKELDYNAAVELASKGWASEARVANTKAAYDAAKAALEVARSEMGKTQIRAPFKGVFEKRLADVGDFLSPGGGCGVVVQLDPMVVLAEAPERNAGAIRVDAPARLRLSDGTEAVGKVRYVAKTADAATRNFRVEVEVENPANAIPVGRVAEVRVQTGQGDAHKINPSLLVTDATGRLGVRYVDVGGVVNFAPTDTVGEGADGVWVAGLPREALIVTEGQENVRPGLRADPRVIEPAG
jgi:multidrug efflux system membrane fusion protein